MFAKNGGEKLYEKVIGHVQNLISTNELKDGDMLPSEGKLSKTLEVSRSTVREGLRILELMGLVETLRGKGTFVRINDGESFKNKLHESFQSISSPNSYYVYEIDKLLEPNIAKLAAQRAGAEDITALKQALEQMEKSIKEGGSGEEESLYFHKCLINILKNPFLNSVFDLTKEIHQRNRGVILNLPYRAREVLQEHTKIYEAVKAGDGNKAGRYMQKHLEKVGRTHNVIYNLIKESPAKDT
ncbi:MAG: FadR/GntR family transcriptional regulator [Peptococcaceae bacterium]